MGHPLYAMIVMGSTVLINIGLDLLFIPVMGLGIKGAGLATGLAFTLGALFNIPRMFQRGQVVSVGLWSGMRYTMALRKEYPSYLPESRFFCSI